jgi:hypothetical protein
MDRDGLIDLTHRSSDGTLMTEVLQPFLSLKTTGPLFDFKSRTWRGQSRNKLLNRVGASSV